ncbi:hypothetical protein R1flu_003577 [Riccia fluitans]|uniref:C3H1-type domain-containing protein n=1 Tax=Riccia fluitans TaxID=41844 RepID=A0ABD1YCU2_9MARC
MRSLTWILSQNTVPTRRQGHPPSRPLRPSSNPSITRVSFYPGAHRTRAGQSVRAEERRRSRGRRKFAEEQALLLVAVFLDFYTVFFPLICLRRHFSGGGARTKMPGVLFPEDEPYFSEDNDMQPSSYYESALSSQVNHSQAQLMRNNSFSGSRETSSLSLTAPVYHRSHSAISSSALQGFGHFFSPPTTPKKSGNGFSGADIADEMSNLNGDGDVLVGYSGALGSSPLSISSGSQHREFQSDLRSFFDGSSSIVGSPNLPGSPMSNIPMSKFLPSNNDDDETWGGAVVDVYACDQFRMFEFKVRRCMRGRSHDWTECPFAHPGEKARRRDPRRFHYSGTACPDFRKGSCRRGDACEFAHGVFECWLHPARYRTQPCKDGRNCRRRVCFFAHTPDQLRLLPAAAQAASAAARNGGSFGLASQLPQLSGSYDGSPGRSGGVSFDGGYGFDSSLTGCVSHCPPSPHGSCQNGSGHGVGCGHFDMPGNAHSGHCRASPHMSSPTSTLVGHSSSPPPLSPPLSPSGSPPMSPQSPHHWPNSPGSQSVSSSSQSSFQVQAACMQASLQASINHQLGFSQGPSSPLSRGSTSSQQALSAAVAAAAAQAHQTQSLTPPAHRRHLDRLNSMPTLSIPQVDHSHRGMMQNVSSPLSSPSSCSPPSPGITSSASVNELIATIQSLNLRGSAIPLWLQAQQAQANQYSSGPSPLRRCSQSVPCTPTKLRWDDRGPPRWEVEEHDVEPPVQRVESGRDLRAKIYGRLGKENRLESEDAPDLGWVNELVKDEQRPNGSCDWSKGKKVMGVVHIAESVLFSTSCRVSWQVKEVPPSSPPLHSNTSEMQGGRLYWSDASGGTETRSELRSCVGVRKRSGPSELVKDNRE